MEIFDVIDQLEDIVENSFTIPIFNKTMLDKDDIMELLSDLRLRLPEELKQAKYIKEERAQIITKAHEEAANMIKETQNEIDQMVNEHEITKKAYDQANEIITNAQRNAREIRLGARQYAENLLNNLENRLINQIEEIKAGRQELKK